MTCPPLRHRLRCNRAVDPVGVEVERCGKFLEVTLQANPHLLEGEGERALIGQYPVEFVGMARPGQAERGCEWEQGNDRPVFHVSSIKTGQE